jgi:WD40 repeat protein
VRREDCRTKLCSRPATLTLFFLLSGSASSPRASRRLLSFVFGGLAVAMDLVRKILAVLPRRVLFWMAVLLFCGAVVFLAERGHQAWVNRTADPRFETVSTSKPYIEPPAVFCFALSSDGKTLALADRKLNIRLWSVSDRKDFRAFSIGGSRGTHISELAFSRDGKLLAVAGHGRLETWDVETGKLQKTFNHSVKGVFWGEVKRVVRGPDDPEAITIPDDPRCIVFSADGKKLFASGLENFIRVWDPATGEETAKLAGHTSPVTWLVMSRDGKTLASGTFYGEIKVWDVDNHKEIASLDNDAPVYGLSLSADGKRLLSTRHTNVTLWDIARKQVVGKFAGAEGPIAFSPDEKLVVATMLNGFTIWDAKSFEKLAALEQNHPYDFAISSDSRTLFSCDYKGKVTLLELPQR